jgi:hypothetical protein
VNAQNHNGTMKAYHIKDWERDRENSDTRKYVELLWFRNKVKLHGEGLGHTLGCPGKQGPFLYGMFKVIEQIAAGCKPRGWLVRNGTAMDATRMGNLMRMPARFFDEALKFFSSAPMDWLELAELPTSPVQVPDGQEIAGRLPGDSPTSPVQVPDGQEIAGRNSTTNERTNVKNVRSKEREREKRGGFASKEEARRAQTQQFAMANDRKRALEAVTEELTEGEEEELKKMRALLREIRKKQAKGDFTPVEEGKDE